MSSMVAKGNAAETRYFGPWRRPVAPGCPFIGAQSSERRAGERRIAFGDLAYQFEKQGQRPRSAFMLRCTMLR